MNNKKNISGIVTSVENYGLFLELENGEKGFLPKENMHISKKKKLWDIFSVGFVIKGTVVNKKKDYYTITQKEEQVDKNNSQKNDASKEKKDVKKEKKHSNKDNKIKNEKSKKQEKKNIKKDNEKVKEKTKVIDAKEKAQEKLTSLTDLKRMKSIGNIKISVSKNKKSVELKEEEKEEKVFLEIPQGFLDNIVSTTENAIEKFDTLEKKLKEKGYLDE